VTVSIIARLKCDRCKTLYRARPNTTDSAIAVRTAASGDGWQIRISGQGRDLCPDCRPPAGRKRPLRRAEQHQAEIVQRYTVWGQSGPQIADALSLSPSAVYAVLTKAGVQRAPKGWPKVSGAAPGSGAPVAAFDKLRTARRVSACMRHWVRHPQVGWLPNGTVTFVYDPSDPYAVQLVFTDDVTSWRFGRNLLADGLAAHAGLGDVRLWPATSPRGVVLLMVLSALGERALLEFPADEVHRFLDRTYRQVPRGAEADRIDFDRLVARLLAETP
jgi:hypothetical protein